MNKKGDKSLQLIFGILVLVIVSFVVLNMFFKWITIGNTASQKLLTDKEKEAVWQARQADCNAACTNALDENSVIEFCAKYYEIDINGDGLIARKSASYGKYDFCEEKVPCFLIANENACTYDGKTCQDLLKSTRPSYYQRFYSPDGTGGCGLDPAAVENWITKFGFNQAP